jgi:two-component system KDP operon response regulator KdpE
MNAATILVVDYDPEVRRVLRSTLSSSGYIVIEAKDGHEAIEIVIRECPDLILLEINLPGMSGLEACRKIRSSFEGPILVVTVRTSDHDKIAAFDSGADNVVVKPFAIRELLARIRAALRQPIAQPLLKVETSELRVDLENRIVDVRGKRIHLTPKEFAVLRLLVIQRGKALTHQRILHAVWGPEHGEERGCLRVVIKELRKKIEEDPAHPRHIMTEPWLGYRFQLPSGSRENGLDA